jgi:hypothetical protein
MTKSFLQTYRTVGIGAVAVTIADLPDDDNMSTWLYSALLAYGFISLAANFLLLVGISKVIALFFSILP